MRNIHTRLCLLVCLAATALAITTNRAIADDFRVDNTVYSGNEQEPSSESTTIFHQGVVYDCLKTPPETVVFDKAAGRFHLLNLRDRARAELTTKQVSDLIDGLRLRVAKSKDPLANFFADPKFEEQFDKSVSELSLTSALVSYRVMLVPQTSPSVVEQYREFCDWYARLRPQLVGGSPPPFARLMVNEAVAKHQATPSRVLLTITAAKGLNPQRTTIRSVHRVVSPLEPADLERATEARAAITGFKLMSFDQYRKVELR